VKKRLMILAAVGLMVGGTAVATAGTKAKTVSFSGSAVAHKGYVSLTSDLTDSTTANDASAVNFTLKPGTTFADLKTLSTQFDPIVGSPPAGATTPLGCGGGSPRFSITLASGQNVFVYLGPSPDFNSCALNTWQSSGNLIGNNDTGRYDTSQVQAGTQSNTYSGALALVGSQEVTSVSLVVDAGWAFTPETQTVLARHIEVNGTVFPKHKLNPARACRAELATLGKTAFEHKYGHNHNLRNAFGKCVRMMAHSKHHH
jgi:hypothetical protein